MTAIKRRVLALFAAAMAAPALAQTTPAPAPAPAADPAPAAAPVPTGPQTFEVALDGDDEVPDEGDPDGKASGTVTIDPAKGTVCSDITYNKLAPVNMAHIHQGAKGKAGPPVVTLTVNDDDAVVKGCAKATPEVIAALLAAPADYYINIHTIDLPKGAVRGQLKR